MINRRTVLICVMLCFVQMANADDAAHAPELPQIPDTVFKVAEHGAAVGSGDNAKAIQETIDAAAAAGGGVVEVPAGELLCGPIKLAEKIDLRLDKGAVLKMLSIDDYPGGTKTPQSFITGQRLHDIAISGEGTIDGQGDAWWPLVKGPKARPISR